MGCRQSRGTERQPLRLPHEQAAMQSVRVSDLATPVYSNADYRGGAIGRSNTIACVRADVRVRGIVLLDDMSILDFCNSSGRASDYEYVRELVLK
jgi:hypothetical protein